MTLYYTLEVNIDELNYDGRYLLMLDRSFNDTLFDIATMLSSDGAKTEKSKDVLLSMEYAHRCLSMKLRNRNDVGNTVAKTFNPAFYRGYAKAINRFLHAVLDNDLPIEKRYSIEHNDVLFNVIYNRIASHTYRTMTFHKGDEVVSDYVRVYADGVDPNDYVQFDVTIDDKDDEALFVDGAPYLVDLNLIRQKVHIATEITVFMGVYLLPPEKVWVPKVTEDKNNT